ncbi:hypothetical protein B0T16DRAFT_414719 [Cercophora newfieldiana]|uniref:Uncharacterized protein n=1 Tax=Cercophora newfieldiana TaxID=92897 RepID=A0AA40CQ92_9PEZI|nr:hypothetical protein B0T16DRAFT_414719 [Cercophora newfieldiana]
MAGILGLPEEIIHMILVEAICNRRFRRALRLKLVCKRFRDAFQPALFESRRLDHTENETVARRASQYRVPVHVGAHRAVYGQRHGADKMWHQYLMYLARNEKHRSAGGSGPFSEIRCIVDAFCAETSADYDATLAAACWLVLDRAANNLDTYQRCHAWQRHRAHPQASNWPPVEFDLNANLLSLAAYLGQEAVTSRLLASGQSPATDNCLLPSPMESAAFAGNANMLSLLQEHRPNPPLGTMTETNKADLAAVYGAAVRGDLDILKLALYPPSRRDNDGKIFGERFRELWPNSTSAGVDLCRALCAAGSWDVYQYLNSAFQPQYSHAGFAHARGNAAYEALRTNAERGNIDMVRGLLDAAEQQHQEFTSHHRECILHLAVRGCHEDVVDLLLDRGWTPDRHGQALNAAATAGSLTLVKKLISHGAQIDKNQFGSFHHALANAIYLEHTDMVQYLLSLQTPTVEFQTKLLEKMTKDRKTVYRWDLDSMLEFVRNGFGGRISPATNSPPRSTRRQGTRTSTRIRAKTG